jgi:hypothetical protein
MLIASPYTLFQISNKEEINSVLTCVGIKSATPVGYCYGLRSYAIFNDDDKFRWITEEQIEDFKNL